jgi:hypothetical protein
MPNQADRAAEQRRVSLEDVRHQIKAGLLTSRELTSQERKCDPPRQAKARRK